MIKSLPIPDSQQIEGYLLTVGVELQHIEASLFRIRHCTERLMDAGKSMRSSAGSLEGMYEELERAIHAPSSSESDTKVRHLSSARKSGKRRRSSMQTHVVLLSPPMASDPPHMPPELMPGAEQQVSPSAVST